MLVAVMAYSNIKDGDVLLSKTGRRQLAFELTAQPDDFQMSSVRKVFCSPLRRALVTALAAYPDHRIIVDPRLREVNACTGMTLKSLRAWLKSAQPERVEDVDFSRLSAGVWWGSEETHDAECRVQRFLKDVSSAHAKRRTGLVAVVSHSVAMHTMAGCPLKPFPKLWGARRGWPKNFKPYFANVRRSAGKPRLVAVAPRSARLVVVRHAHSSKQAARTKKKKLLKRLKRKAK